MEKSFKKMLFGNIYFLLKAEKRKIRDFEVEAGVSAGYVSRTKESNASPGVDFVLKTADILNISVDTLLTIDLAAATPTELYLRDFLTKLIRDTRECKLYWEREEAEALNNQYFSGYGVAGYGPEIEIVNPMFEWKRENDIIDEKNQEPEFHAVFKSRSFGLATEIDGDCFKLKLKNNTLLYVMNIAKFVGLGEQEEKAIEIWMFKDGLGKEFICDDSNPQFERLVSELNRLLHQYMLNPRLRPDSVAAIDAFMADDLEDDPVKFDPNNIGF